MEKIPLLIGAALIALLTTTAMGRVGSSAMDCWRKYGDPVAEVEAGNSTIRTFRTRGFEIKIFFHGSRPDPKQRAFRICYKKMPSDWTPETSQWRGAHIPSEQMQQLLAENGGKRKWTGTREEGFKTEDGYLIASFDPSSNELVIETPLGD